MKLAATDSGSPHSGDKTNVRLHQQLTYGWRKNAPSRREIHEAPSKDSCGSRDARIGIPGIVFEGA